jgi:hypothetical protein
LPRLAASLKKRWPATMGSKIRRWICCGSIDVEEFNQKRLAANRSFDAVESAYRRREFSQAQAMLSMIDARLLDNSRQSRLREINLTPEMNPSVVSKTPVPSTTSGCLITARPL